MKNRDAESGMVIVEATIVFPVMFLVIFLMIFMGNAYLQKARVEAIVNETAIEGAAQCVDPMLKSIEENGSVPSFSDSSSSPYRYLIGGMDSIENDLDQKLKDRINGMTTGLFDGMKPVFSDSTMGVKFNNKFVASSFSVDLNYKIVLPIRLMGAQENFSLNLSSHNEIPVMDSPDFIQNTDMVEDMLERIGVAQAAQEGLDKITELTQKFNSWFNRGGN